MSKVVQLAAPRAEVKAASAQQRVAPEGLDLPGCTRTEPQGAVEKGAPLAELADAYAPETVIEMQKSKECSAQEAREVMLEDLISRRRRGRGPLSP